MTDYFSNGEEKVKEQRTALRFTAAEAQCG